MATAGPAAEAAPDTALFSALRADFLRRRLRRPDGSEPPLSVVESLAEARTDGVPSVDELETTGLPCPCFTPSAAAVKARSDGLSPASDAPAFGVSPSRRSFTVFPVVCGEQICPHRASRFVVGKRLANRRTERKTLFVPPQGAFAVLRHSTAAALQPACVKNWKKLYNRGLHPRRLLVISRPAGLIFFRPGPRWGIG